MNVLFLHHSHHESNPPAFNAINCISNKVSQLTILSTATIETKWKYRSNTNLILLDGIKNRFEANNISKWNKLKSYYNYVRTVYSLIKKNNFQLLIIHDNIPFLFFVIAKKFLRKKVKVWFHNHDIYPLSHYKKYSINWLAAKSVQKNFSKINYFSLPALERKKMFPLDNYKGKFFYIPNYPSSSIIQPIANIIKTRSIDRIKLVYPGSPSHKNGFEELLYCLKKEINKKQLELYIIGDSNPVYKKHLIELATNIQVEKQLFFIDRVPYIEMPALLQTFHIGWGVYKPVDLSVATAATSSNKIYESLANSLPVIVYDNHHHKEHLNKYKSIFFTTIKEDNIINTITQIDNDYNKLINSSRVEFETHFQFDNVFNPIFDLITKDLSN